MPFDLRLVSCQRSRQTGKESQQWLAGKIVEVRVMYCADYGLVADRFP